MDSDGLELHNLRTKMKEREMKGRYEKKIRYLEFLGSILSSKELNFTN